ncbi:unnamed protein product [Ascophyllum nodosum]
MLVSTSGSTTWTKSMNDLGTSSLTSGPSYHPYLKSKFQIGSAKCSKNFGRNLTAFHRDDVPFGPRERKEEVKEWKGRKIISMGKRPGWCSSVSLDPAWLKEPRTKINSEQDPSNPYQYNYRAENLPPKFPEPVPRPSVFKVSCVTEEEVEKRRIRRREYPDNALERPKRVAEIPTNRALARKPAWNFSSQLDDRERRKEPAGYEVPCKRAGARKNGQLRTYTALKQRERERRHHIRQLKREGQLWALRESKPSPLAPTYNRLAKDPIRRLRSYSHSGKWEFREPEACIMWSDTASCNRESVGDLIRVHNPNGFNFSAPCLTSVVGWESR